MVDELIIKPRCKLIGEDGNVFAIMGNVSRTLKKAGMKKEANAFFEEVSKCKSYNETLIVVNKYVEVI